LVVGHYPPRDDSFFATFAFFAVKIFWEFDRRQFRIPLAGGHQLEPSNSDFANDQRLMTDDEFSAFPKSRKLL